MSTRYSVACPTCGALPFRSCRTLMTGRVTDTHTARIDQAHRVRRLVAPLAPEQTAPGDEGHRDTRGRESGEEEA